MGGLAMGRFIVSPPFPVERAFGLGPVLFSKRYSTTAAISGKHQYEMPSECVKPAKMTFYSARLHGTTSGQTIYPQWQASFHL